jgi:hypothetical protein
MRTSVSLWFAPSLAVVMLDRLTGAFNTTFFVVVFLVGCFEFAFMVSLLSLFFPFWLDRLLFDRGTAALYPKNPSSSPLIDCPPFRWGSASSTRSSYFNLTCRILPNPGSP